MYLNVKIHNVSTFYCITKDIVNWYIYIFVLCVMMKNRIRATSLIHAQVPTSSPTTYSADNILLLF